MGIGRQQHALAERAHAIEEVRRAGQVADVRAHLGLQRGDVEAEFLAPVIDAVPVQRAALGVEARLQLREGRDRVEPALRAPPVRQRLEPEQVVEAQVEDRAVHVEANGFDP